MASFAEILAKKPKVQTRQALMVLGLQNEFIASTGHLPVDTTSGFLDRIHSLIPKFRELNGNIIWVQALYEADRLTSTSNTREGEGDALVIAGLVDGEETGSQAGDDESIKDESTSVPQPQSRSERHKQRVLNLFKSRSSRRKALPLEEAKVIIEEDEELFLLKRVRKGAACMPDSEGASFTTEIKDLIETPRDALIKTTNYSAFLGTNLLLTLRARLITEIYVCGCLSNVNVLATVIDGARHGIKINVIQDALGYRRQARHELALKRMEDFFDAHMVTTTDVLAKEHFTVVEPVKEDVKPDAKDPEKARNELEALVGNLSLNEKSSATATPSHNKSSTTANVQIASSKTAGPKAREGSSVQDADSDEEFFASALRRPRRTNGAEQMPSNTGEPNLVQSKPRMRKKKKKKRPTEEPSAELSISNGDLEKVPSNGAAEPAAATSETAEQQQPAALNGEAKSEAVETNDDAAHVSTIANVSEGSELNKDGSADSPSTKAPQLESTTDSAHTLSTSLAQADSSTALLPENSAKSETLSTSDSQTNIMAKSSKLKSLANLPVLGPGDRIAEGDSRIIHDIIPSDYHPPSDPSKPLAQTIFQQLYAEVRWQKMMHQQGEVPRLVCCQGEFGDDGSKPVYRHPADQTLPLLHFSPKVQYIRRQAETLVGHRLNHVLIQLYRSGNDHISEHSDKTLDIAEGSSIVNVSFGAQRTMRLRTKRESRSKGPNNEESQRSTQRVAMPHNSMLVLGLRSNERWLHGIMPDKRLPAERNVLETAYGGNRISLTFRHIATFLDAKETVIWGQGATSKDARGAADVVNGDATEAERIIRAFGAENHGVGFDWDDWYGDGFDVLHLHEPPAQAPLLFASTNALETKQIQLALWEAKIGHTMLDAPDLDKEFGLGQKVMFRDDDTHFTEVEGVAAILHYLDRYHSFCADRPVTARSYALVEAFAHVSPPSFDSTVNEAISKQSKESVLVAQTELKATLHALNEQLKDHGGPFIAGNRFSIADCVVWPLLDACMDKWEEWDESTWQELAEYCRATWKKKSCLKKLRAELPAAKKI
jgi:nicotinamidase-related amidase/glutathione S-transferase/alkylated DNA repair dioxygenase AlkB